MKWNIGEKETTTFTIKIGHGRADLSPSLELEDIIRRTRVQRDGERVKTLRCGHVSLNDDEAGKEVGSPTVYRTDRETWIVQGWRVTDPDALARMDIPGGETAVEIPDRMIAFFRREGRDASNG